MSKGYVVKSDGTVEATERIYLTADKSKVVAESSPDAAYLFATPGKRIPATEVERLGLVKGQKPAPEPEPEPAPEPEPEPEPEVKAVGKAPVTKAVERPPQNKGR